jgi:hypothetical protein
MMNQISTMSIIGRNKTTSIEKPKVVLCEGLEETVFFPRLFKVMNRIDLFEGIQFLTYDGKNNLPNFTINGLVKLPGFKSIASLGIMMDSDGEPEGVQPSFQSIQNILRTLFYPVPDTPGHLATTGNLKTISWIFPDNQSRGEFEDVCVKALSTHPMFPCLESLRKCIGTKGCVIPRSAKAPLYTILAWHEPCGRRLGELGDNFLSTWDLSAFQNIIGDFFDQL